MTFGSALMLALAFSAGAFGVAPESPDGLRRRLAASASVRWEGVARGDALRRLGDEFGVPLWVDRRVDPTASLSLDSGEQPVADLLSAAVEESGFSAAVFDRVVYVGPPRSAAALSALADVRRERPMRGRGVTRWPRRSTPRDLATRLAEGAGLTLTNPEAIPHDLWPVGETPELTVGDRLTLLLIGFDLRWEWAGESAVVVKPCEYRSSTPKVPPLLAAKDRRRAGGGEKRFTLRVVDQPLGPLLAGLAKQLGLAYGPAALPQEKAAQRVSFDVKQATLEELLAAVSEAAGVGLTVSDGELTVQGSGGD